MLIHCEIYEGYITPSFIAMVLRMDLIFAIWTQQLLLRPVLPLLVATTLSSSERQDFLAVAVVKEG
jgi:hypothetical protein